MWGNKGMEWLGMESSLTWLGAAWFGVGMTWRGAACNGAEWNVMKLDRNSKELDGIDWDAIG